MILTLAWVCVALLAAGGIGLIAWAVVAEIRDRKASEDDEAPKGYTGVHRKGAIREPHQPPTWATALAEPTDALTEPTQAMPLVELRGEIGRHSWHPRDVHSLAPQRAGVVAGWATWPTDEWQIREAEVWGEAADVH